MKGLFSDSGASPPLTCPLQEGCPAWQEGTEGGRTFRSVLGHLSAWRGCVRAGGCPRREFQTRAASFHCPHPLTTSELPAQASVPSCCSIPGLAQNINLSR